MGALAARIVAVAGSKKWKTTHHSLKFRGVSTKGIDSRITWRPKFATVQGQAEAQATEKVTRYVPYVHEEFLLVHHHHTTRQKRQLFWQHLCPICPKTWRLNYWQVLLWSYEVAFHFLPSLGAPVQILLGLTVGTGGTIGSCQRNCRMNGWQMRIGKLLFAGDRMERWQSGVWYVWQLHCALVFIRRSFAPRGRSMWPFCGVAKRHSSNNDHRLQKEQYILWICLQVAHRNSSRFQESKEKHFLHCTLCI